MTTPNPNRRSGSEPPRQHRDSIELLEAKLEEAQTKLSRLDKVNALIQENRTSLHCETLLRFFAQ